MKNYSAAWVTGSENQRTSNLLNHAIIEQHKLAMELLLLLKLRQATYLLLAMLLQQEP